MSDKRRTSRDIWRQPPGPAVDDYADPNTPKDEPDEAETTAEIPAVSEGDRAMAEEAAEPDRYAPKHRAPGRAPLIRRRRARVGDEEQVSWETTWREEPKPTRWSEEEESSVAPPPRPIEDISYLGPTRAEQRGRKPKTHDEEESSGLVRRSRDYSGRHLAKKQSGRGTQDQERDEPPPDQEPGLTRDEPGELTAGVQQQPVIADSSASAPQDAAPADAAVEAPEAVQPGAVAPPPADAPVRRSLPPMVEGDIELGPAIVIPPPPDVIDLVEPEPEAPDPESSALPPVEAAPDARPADSGDQAVEPVTVPLTSRETTGNIWPGEDVAAGPRTSALQERKKKKRSRQTLGAIAAMAAAIAAVVGAGFLVKNAVEEPEQRVAVPLDVAAPEPEGGTTLLFGTKESSSSGRGAIWMTLVTLDPAEEKASIVYIPPHTAVEVPGRGLQGVGEAYGSGGVPLLLVSAENLLGIKIDNYIELSDKDALVFFEALGNLTIDVPAEVRVPVGKEQARLIFVEGPQELTPDLIVKLLYIVGLEGDDVELGSRHLAFWGELLDAYDDGQEVADAVVEAGAALSESDATTEEHAAFFSDLAEVPGEDVTITALPVRPISAGDSELYATDAEELRAFVEETIGVDQNAPAEIRVQLLNGNGVPGIGREVADLLVGEGFRVILGGNARRLNYRKTLVIAYDSSDEGVAIAERAAELMGVGEVRVSAQEQGIVDLTIVVGKDFMRAR